MTDLAQPVSHERPRRPLSGWFMLLMNFFFLFSGIAVIVYQAAITSPEDRLLWLIFAGTGLELVAILLFCGHFTLQPNEARVLILFGRYHGTVRQSGFFWANPFYSRSRARIPIAGAEPVANR